MFSSSVQSKLRAKFTSWNQRQHFSVSYVQPLSQRLTLQMVRWIEVYCILKETLYCIFITSLFLPSISWRARVNVCIHITLATAFEHCWEDCLQGCYINACRHNHAISFSMFLKHVWALYSILWSHCWSFYILYPVDYLNKLKLPLLLFYFYVLLIVVACRVIIVLFWHG